MNVGIAAALLAAVLFGASTPLAKLLVGGMAPAALAGLLYAGSGIGLSIWWLLRRGMSAASGVASLKRRDLGWLAAAIAVGGVAGPLLLMLGLARSPASSASLLLNLEGVFTALCAWFVFRENFDRRIAAGMALIVCGGVLLAWEPSGNGLALSPGALAVIAACACWALDNNLTRKISAADAVQIAAIKGLAAGAVNLGIAAVTGAALPAWDQAAWAMLLGLGGYGVSLALFVVALRHLGTARTGAYFSSAPFVGAALAFVVTGESPQALFWIAAALMAAGIWLHLTERHAHPHTHEPLAHEHSHVHDEHHQHQHDFAWDGSEPHTHAHVHERLVHSHPHYPDIHHRHEHS